MKNLTQIRLAIAIVFGALFYVVVGGPMCLAAEQADLAWPEADGKRADIYYNAYRDGNWTGKVRVSDPLYNNMHPEMVVINDETIFLVWTAVDGFRNRLFFSMKTKGAWGQALEIKTGQQSSIGPEILLDAAGVPWIAWAGNNGGLDDIYVSSWDGENWSSPVQINPENAVPDILPELMLTVAGELQIVWQKYENGEYRFYQSVFRNKGWSKPVPGQEGSVGMNKESLKKDDKVKGHGSVPFPPSFHPLKDDESVYNLQVR